MRGLLGLTFVLGSVHAAEVGWDTPNIVLMEDNTWKQIDFQKTYVDGPQPMPPVDDRWKSNEATITILIAALREVRCATTLKDMFSNASYPYRLRVGVVQQNEPEDEDCQIGFCERMGTPAKKRADGGYEAGDCKHFDQIRMLRLRSSEAKGPVYARALGATLVHDEDDFCVQIDAHSGVVKGWDSLMLGEWHNASNEFAVLTTYPLNIHDIGKNTNNHWEMPHLCAASNAGEGVVHNERARAAANLQRPILAPLWAAGLSFSRCHAERNVPNDIELKQIFTGEEFGRGVRLWTHGYDFYSPSRMHIGTFYGGEKGSKGGWQGNHTEQQVSQQRLATLMRTPSSDQSAAAIAKLGKYGLGDKRTLEQYIEFSGVDPGKLRVVQRCVCKWVPWDWTETKKKLVAAMMTPAPVDPTAAPTLATDPPVQIPTTATPADAVASEAKDQLPHQDLSSKREMVLSSLFQAHHVHGRKSPIVIGDVRLQREAVLICLVGMALIFAALQCTPRPRADFTRYQKNSV